MFRFSHFSRVGAALAVVAGSCLVSVASAGPASASCPPDPITIVKQTSIFYRSIGSAAGKHNPSPNTSTLSYSLGWTTSRASAWEGGASASVSFGVAQVEAHTNYTVTKTTATNKSTTDTVSVPGGYYGYAQPKAEFRVYHMYSERTNGNCKGVTDTEIGYFDAITAVPFYAECVAKKQCTPTP